MIKNKVNIVSLGCSKNLVDSEQLLYQFAENGYSISHDPSEIDGEIVVVNTCGFIGDAKEESINTILELSELKLDGKISKLYVMGCLSERYRADLEENIGEVDGFYGKFDWKNLLSDLGKKSLESDKRVLTTPAHYAYVKIAEGCDRTCSYCAIPLITGPYRSRPQEQIVEEVKDLVAHGIKEIQLIAQDLTYYGLELYKENRLAQLVEELAQIEGLEWIRLHYGYPNHFPYDLLPVMAKYDNVCAYMDVALQHITDHMLKVMRRNLTRQQTIDFIKRLRQEVPNLHLRTTMLVGHPGETQEDFDELKEFVKEIRFERMGAFAYSNEEGTYAYKHYEDTIPQEVKEERRDELMRIQTEIMLDTNELKIGKTYKIVIDREEEDSYVGRTEFDSPEVDCEVIIPKDANTPLEIGCFYKASIDSADLYDLTAHIVD